MDPHALERPSSWVERFLPLIPRRTAGGTLDLACGRGRHVRALRAHGLGVVALDRDPAALAAIADPAVEKVAADLEAGGWPFGERRFDGIVVTNYLHRPLFPALARALNPGGILIYETFARGNERFGRPRNPDHLLKPGELLAAFAQLHVIAYGCGAIGDERPRVVARLCAARAETPVDAAAFALEAG
ncbi:MAG: class I SAM-dependent methyltransferase [Alphaproteobacteria bacterium]|nr:class I SAM-dependent methyltransferase [Alphaproteobacteria bacterium]